MDTVESAGELVDGYKTAGLFDDEGGSRELIAAKTLLIHEYKLHLSSIPFFACLVFNYTFSVEDERFPDIWSCITSSGLTYPIS